MLLLSVWTHWQVKRSRCFFSSRQCGKSKAHLWLQQQSSSHKEASFCQLIKMKWFAGFLRPIQIGLIHADTSCVISLFVTNNSYITGDRTRRHKITLLGGHMMDAQHKRNLWNKDKDHGKSPPPRRSLLYLILNHPITVNLWNCLN